MSTSKITLMFLLCSGFLFSNNIKVDSISLVDQDAVVDTVRIQFDLGWDNSWHLSIGPSNWDAAWVFGKVRINGGTWDHIHLNYIDGTNDGHTGPADVTIKTVTNGIGCFIYRSVDGNGTVDWDNIELSWDYGSDGIDADDILDIQIFAIEMVYIPEGAFFVGGGFGNETYKFYQHPTLSNSFQIASENAINVGPTSGYLNYDNSGTGGDGLGPIPAAYPKGYNAFYCMKYECSEEQWVSFFNTLDPIQKITRDITDGSHKGSDATVSRNTVSWLDNSSNATTVVPDRVCSFINLGDSFAYMDWAGLRPLTELEYEKACRGPNNVRANEYAWGTANIFGENYSLSNSGQNSEKVSNPGVMSGNALYNLTEGTIDGPLRTGVFAASAINNNREETGGTFYGVMEMSGNIYERPVTVGHPQGRLYTGEHGDGILNASGDHTTNNWPNTITGDGASLRGGTWLSQFDRLQTSNRVLGAFSTTAGSHTRGMRAAHTAP